MSQMIDPHQGQITIPLNVDLAVHLYPALLLWTEYFLFSDRFSNPSNGKIRLAEGIQLRPLTLNVLIAGAYVSRVEFVCSHNSNIPCKRAGFFYRYRIPVNWLFPSSSGLSSSLSFFEQSRFCSQAANIHGFSRTQLHFFFACWVSARLLCQGLTSSSSDYSLTPYNVLKSIVSV